METLRTNHYRKETGLTLIEVLIALAITAIALTAVIKAASQNIRATSYLENKTIAMWVGEDIMNEVRVGVLKISDDKVKQSSEMLGREWFWQAESAETPNNHIKKITVKVYTREDEDADPIITLESFTYRADVN